MHDDWSSVFSEADSHHAPLSETQDMMRNTGSESSSGDNYIILPQAAQAHVWRKSQRLIHELVTSCDSLREEPLKIWTRHKEYVGNELWSIYNGKYYEIWIFYT